MRLITPVRKYFSTGTKRCITSLSELNLPKASVVRLLPDSSAGEAVASDMVMFDWTVADIFPETSAVHAEYLIRNGSFKKLKSFP